MYIHDLNNLLNPNKPITPLSFKIYTVYNNLRWGFSDIYAKERFSQFKMWTNTPVHMYSVTQYQLNKHEQHASELQVTCT